MRWRFLSSSPRDAALRAKVTRKIDDWWSAFRNKTSDIDELFHRKAQWDLPAWMAETLQAVHPSLMWEFGPAVRGKGHRLVITPESARHLRPLATTILERVPRLDGWEFYGYRLPEPVASAQQTVEGRVGVDISDFQIRVAKGDNGRIDLGYFYPSTMEPEDNEFEHAAFVATECLLGEERLDKWIGAIDSAPMPSGQGRLKRSDGNALTGHLVALDRLKETVDAVIGSHLEQLPAEPHDKWIDETEWSMWKLQPDEEGDYPEQLDLFVGRSANPEFWLAAHSAGPFVSERFSRCGETFCYLKIDGAEGLEGSEFAGKDDIEDAIDETLRPQKLGCNIGGGTGLRYSYVDLALTNVDQGIAAIRQRLQDGKFPRRSWIQFHDADLCAEWVGIYDDTPPPPMPDFDQG